ncbi:MAG: TIGR03086 family metal-binding protein [Actinomycetaceae bacterium]
MTPQFDLGPAATRLAQVAERITDDQLDDPTPDGGWTVRDLLVHVVDLTEAFRAAGTKETGPSSAGVPAADGSALGREWREPLVDQLRALSEVWRDPAAWEGTTYAGGLEMPGDVTAVVALDEIVLHGWDLAVATGQPYAADDAETEVLLTFVEEFDPDGSEGMFGPALDADGAATGFDRLLARSGRDPGWRTTAR